MSGTTRIGRGGWIHAVFAVVLCLAWSATNPVGATVYVDRDAPGPIHDGASWTTAFVEIQDAVDAAAAKTGGDEVWVAEGVYSGDILTSSGVRLYGGFLGADAPTTETSLAQRDWVNNTTELSGSSSDHLLDFDAATTVGIDGFTFAAGTDYAIVGTSAIARIAHCRFPGNNRAIQWGDPFSVSVAEISLEDCQFEGNAFAICVENIRSLSLRNCLIDSSTKQGVRGTVCKVAVENCVISNVAEWPVEVTFPHPGSFPETYPEEPGEAIFRDLRVSGNTMMYDWWAGDFALVVVDRCEFLDNMGGPYFPGCTRVEVSECRFLRNRRGGLLGVGNSDSVPSTGFVRDCLFQDNGWAPAGESGPVDNYATNSGIAILSADGPFVVENCQFLHNASRSCAIVAAGITMNVRDCTFRENVCLLSPDGGGIGIVATPHQSAPGRISRCVFENNTAAGGVHMISVAGANSYVVEDTRIANNAAGGIFLSIHLEEEGLATVERCVVENNGPTAHSGIGVAGPRVRFVDSRVQGNDTQSGGVWVYAGDAEVSRCKILDNNAHSGGGGLTCWESSRIRIVDSRIVGNSTLGDCGGIEIRSADNVEISDSIVSGNRAARDLTAGIMVNNTSGGSRISECVVTGNQGASFGSGIWIGYSTPCRIENCVIAGQRGSSVACGLSLNDEIPVELANCTLFGNTGSDLGIGVFSSDSLAISNTQIARNSTHGVYAGGAGYPPRFDSCLFYANGRGDYFNHDLATTVTGAAAINALPNGTGALNSGNVEGDPRFVPGIRGMWAADGAYDSATSRTVLTVGSADAAFTTDSLIGRLILSNDDYEDLYVILSNTPTQLTVLGDATAFAPAGRAFEILDFHLDPSYCSPALDTGTDLNAPDVDLDGAPRPVDLPGIGADGTGTAFDIGAYELQETTPTHRLVVAPESVDFGTAVVGETSIPTTITLTNTGTAAVSFRGQGLVIAGADADQFVLAPPDLDPIAPCETRFAFVSFTPSAAGTHSATLRVLTDDDLAPTILVSLAGEAIAPTPTPTETPTPTATPAGPDADHDGISDVYERAHGSDPYDPASLPMNLDLDGNGLVDRDDAMALYQVLSGQIPANPDADYVSMDFNGDGETNILDALLFYRNRAGVIPMIPLAE